MPSTTMKPSYNFGFHSCDRNFSKIMVHVLLKVKHVFLKDLEQKNLYFTVIVHVNDGVFDQFFLKICYMCFEIVSKLGSVNKSWPQPSLTTSDFFSQVIIFVDISLLIHIYRPFERRFHALANRKLFRNVHLKVWPHNHNIYLACFPYLMK